MEQLFDAESDPRELRDRARDEPEKLSACAAIADAYLADASPPGATPPTREDRTSSSWASCARSATRSPESRVRSDA